MIEYFVSLDAFRVACAYIKALDFSQPLAWVLVAAFVSYMIAAYHFSAWVDPYVNKINALIDKLSAKILGID
jgi:uncharacterized protein YggT (Ycf19 family)